MLWYLQRWMKGRPDYYWRKSKEEGFPARSVFKLREIQQKLQPLRPGSRVLDLGASPGSWSLFVLDFLGSEGSAVGVDLNRPDGRLLNRPRYRFIQGDFTSPPVVQQIVAEGPFDAVLSDAAPSTTGIRTVDTGRSMEIAWQVLALCEQVLAPGGSCVLKIFPGGEEKLVLDRMRSLFGAARAYKPRSSRPDSMETYFIGLGFTKP
jgi:23S rRNA (uridine2552-2'-O)-methyltransferase